MRMLYNILDFLAYTAACLAGFGGIALICLVLSALQTACCGDARCPASGYSDHTDWAKAGRPSQ